MHLKTLICSILYLPAGSFNSGAFLPHAYNIFSPAPWRPQMPFPISPQFLKKIYSTWTLEYLTLPKPQHFQFRNTSSRNLNWTLCYLYLLNKYTWEQFLKITLISPRSVWDNLEAFEFRSFYYTVIIFVSNKLIFQHYTVHLRFGLPFKSTHNNYILKVLCLHRQHSKLQPSWSSTWRQIHKKVWYALATILALATNGI